MDSHRPAGRIQRVYRQTSSNPLTLKKPAANSPVNVGLAVLRTQLVITYDLLGLRFYEPDVITQLYIVTILFIIRIIVHDYSASLVTMTTAQRPTRGTYKYGHLRRDVWCECSNLLGLGLRFTMRRSDNVNDNGDDNDDDDRWAVRRPQQTVTTHVSDVHVSLVFVPYI